jgi:hypothetical protein
MPDTTYPETVGQADFDLTISVAERFSNRF